MQLRTALAGNILLVGVVACSSIEGIELRIGGVASDQARAIVATAAQGLGFIEVPGGCNLAGDLYCAERPSPYDSWPLTLSTQVRSDDVRVFVGRRNIGLTREEQAVIADLVRNIGARGITIVVERTFGVRLPKDLQPFLAKSKS